jgi:hypothetical protein
LRPRLLDDLERFEKPLAAFRVRHAIGDIGSRIAAAPNAEQQSAFADLVDRRGLFGKAQGVAERQNLHAGADLDAVRPRGDRGGDGQRRGQHRTARLLVDFGEPDGVETPAVRRLDLPQRLLERSRRGLIRPAVKFMINPNFHCFSPAGNAASATVIDSRQGRLCLNFRLR